MIDSNKRILVKTVSWRVVATLATFLVSYFISNDLNIASSIAGTQIILHTMLYVIHEQVWNQLEWGRIKKGAR